MSKKLLGPSIDDFLKEEGIFEEAQAQAVKEAVPWQLAQAMKRKKISKARMATLLRTSRTQVDRLLDARNDITLSSLLACERIFFTPYLGSAKGRSPRFGRASASAANHFGD
jgi:antitoxin HicB